MCVYDVNVVSIHLRRRAPWKERRGRKHEEIERKWTSVSTTQCAYMYICASIFACMCTCMCLCVCARCMSICKNLSYARYTKVKHRVIMKIAHYMSTCRLVSNTSVVHPRFNSKSPCVRLVICWCVCVSAVGVCASGYRLVCVRGYRLVCVRRKEARNRIQL